MPACEGMRFPRSWQLVVCGGLITSNLVVGEGKEAKERGWRWAGGFEGVAYIITRGIRGYGAGESELLLHLWTFFPPGDLIFLHVSSGCLLMEESTRALERPKPYDGRRNCIQPQGWRSSFDPNVPGAGPSLHPFVELRRGASLRPQVKAPEPCAHLKQPSPVVEAQDISKTATHGSN